MTKPMTTAQAKKIATAAGLVCEFHAIGKFWRAVNPTTGARVVFDALYLRSYGNERFQNEVNKIK